MTFIKLNNQLFALIINVVKIFIDMISIVLYLSIKLNYIKLIFFFYVFFLPHSHYQNVIKSRTIIFN